MKSSRLVACNGTIDEVDTDRVRCLDVDGVYPDLYWERSKQFFLYQKGSQPRSLASSDVDSAIEELSKKRQEPSFWWANGIVRRKFARSK